MCQHTDEVDHLPESSIYLLPFHVDLVVFTKTKATYCSEFPSRTNLKHLSDECSLQYSIILGVHVVFGIPHLTLVVEL